MGFTEPDAHDYPKDLHDLGSGSNRVWKEVFYSVQFLRHNRGEGPLKTTNVREFEGEPLVTTGGLTQCCHVRHNEETGLRSLIGVCKALVLLNGTKKDL